MNTTEARSPICAERSTFLVIGERDTLRSVQLRIVDILLASERSERDTLRSVQSRIVYIYILWYMQILFL